MNIEIKLDDPKCCDGCPCDAIDLDEDPCCLMGYWNIYTQKQNKKHETIRSQECIDKHGR